MTKLKLTFIFAATQCLNEKIDYFEKRKANIHNATSVVEDILLDHMRRYIAETELNDFNEESENLERKKLDDILKIDLEKVKVVSNKEMFVGNMTEKIIRSLGLSLTSKQLEWFYDKIRKFHVTVLKFLVKYFGQHLRNPITQYYSALGQSQQSHLTTATYLKRLVTNYTKVVDNIDAVDGVDKIKSEIDRYVFDDEVKMFEKDMDYEEFWLKVSELTEGSAGWTKYEILPNFALGLSAKFNSNSEVERSFSVMNNLHSNKQRNSLSHDALNYILHIRSNVESKAAKNNCEKCTKYVSDHCHCCQFVITEEIRKHCNGARRKYASSLEEIKSSKENTSEEMKAR